MLFTTVIFLGSIEVKIIVENYGWKKEELFLSWPM
jgi:hypothetical protein